MESVEVNDLEKVKCRISGKVFEKLTANISLTKRDTLIRNSEKSIVL